MLPSLMCWILVQLPSQGQGESGATPQDEQIRGLRERITVLRTANDLAGLRRLVTEAKTVWLPTKNAAYYPVILNLCSALKSMAPSHPDVYDAMRDLAVVAIDSSVEKSPDTAGKLLLLLQGDPEYSRGLLNGEEWAKERRTRTERWLKVWKSIHEQLAALPEPAGPRYVQVSPPPETGFPDGVAPSAIKDPVLRKRYEDAIETNTRNIKAYRKKHDLADFEKRFTDNAKQQLTSSYNKPPFATAELEKLLTESRFEARTRAEVVGEVKKRMAARMERESRQPPPPRMQITEPAPPSDAPTYHADPRLRVKVSFDLKAPLVEDVLHELRQATKVNLSRADDIQNQYAAHGSLSFRSVPAWQVMDTLAKSKRVEGRWEKDGDGYRLVGNGNPVVIPEASEKRTGGGSSGRRLLIAYALGLLLCLALWGIKRYRSRRTVSS